MQAERRISVVILYTHPLFGEGLARLLAAEPGVDVVPVCAVDIETAQRSLALAPDVVIFERGDPDRAVDVLRFAPEALLIDVAIGPGPTFTYYREEIPARPEGLLRAIRQVRRPESSVKPEGTTGARAAAEVPGRAHLPLRMRRAAGSAPPRPIEIDWGDGTWARPAPPPRR